MLLTLNKMSLKLWKQKKGKLFSLLNSNNRAKAMSIMMKENLSPCKLRNLVLSFTLLCLSTNLLQSKLRMLILEWSVKY